MNWRWVDRQAHVLLHDESLAEHGGSAGVRDDGLPESALARAKNLAVYGNRDIAELAAAYGVGLAKHHAFVDGNERAAFLAVGMFLKLNGYRLVTTQVDATLTMLALAAGEIDDKTFAAWIRDHARAR